ncbi:MAG: ABC transporter permease [Bacteroidota bacterium]
MPMSVTISNLLKFLLQLLIFLAFYSFYYIQGAELVINLKIMLFPVYILMMALLGLGLGMIISSMTTKYRDMSVVIGFATSLLMYMSAVPYPISEARKKFPDWVSTIVELNPLTQIIEGFRYILLNTGTFTWTGFGYVLTISIALFFVGIVIFNRTEKSFIDTV